MADEHHDGMADEHHDGMADEHHDGMADEHHDGMAMGTAGLGDPYPLTSCPVSGEELGAMGEPIIYDHNGREIRFCCANCIGKFEAEPEKYISAIDAQIIAEQTPDYPMTTCMVTGDELGGEMGPAVDYVYNNRLVRFCCRSCIKDFNEAPAAWLGQLDQAVIDAQLADYPLNTCVVTGEELGEMGEPVDYVFANRLVRFCCPGCVADFEADPAQYLAQIDAAS
jgi:YHS domain-containing protein